MMVPLLGLEAIRSATMAMMSTTTRPIQNISLSLALPLRKMGLYTSLANADALASSWLSAVDMEAARMAESRIPLTTGGKMRRTIWMNTVELSSISPSSIRPTTPEATAKPRISSVQVTPMAALFLISLSDRTDMKRMMICGIPK